MCPGILVSWYPGHGRIPIENQRDQVPVKQQNQSNVRWRPAVGKRIKDTQHLTSNKVNPSPLYSSPKKHHPNPQTSTTTFSKLLFGKNLLTSRKRKQGDKNPYCFSLDILHALVDDGSHKNNT